MKYFLWLAFLFLNGIFIPFYAMDDRSATNQDVTTFSLKAEFFECIAQGDLERMIQLLKKDTALAHCFYEDQSVVGYSVNKKKWDIVSYFLDNKIYHDIELIIPSPVPLNVSCEQEKEIKTEIKIRQSLILLVIKKGFSILTQVKKDSIASSFIKECCYYSIVFAEKVIFYAIKYAIENVVDNEGLMELSELLHYDVKDLIPPFRTLLQCAIVTGQDTQGNGLLHFLASNEVIHKSVDIFRKALSLLIMQIDIQNTCGLTPLHVAINSNALYLVQELLAHKADITRLDNKGYSCFDYAINNHPQILWQFAGIGSMCEYHE